MRLPITFLILAAAAAAQEPKIVFDKGAHDFGTLWQGEDKATTFRFTNAGKGELTISNVRSTCGCAVAALEKKVYAPGESGEVEVVFKSLRFKGEIDKKVYVYSNDPKTPMAALGVRAFVKTFFAVEPEMLIFGDVLAGKTVTREVVLTSVEKKKFKVEGVKLQFGNPAFSFKPEPVEGSDGTAQKVLVTLKADGPPRWVGDFMLIRTDLQGDRGEVRVFVEGKVAGEFSVEPNSVYFGYLTPDKLPVRTIRITNRGKDLIGIGSVEVEGEQVITSRVETVKEGREFDVVLSLKEGVKPGRFYGKLKVMVTGRKEELVIPFSGYVRKQQP